MASQLPYTLTITRCSKPHTDSACRACTKTKEGSVLWLDPNGIDKGAKNKKKGASFRFGICLLQKDIRKGPFKIGKITWNCSWLKCVYRTISYCQVPCFVSSSNKFLCVFWNGKNSTKGELIRSTSFRQYSKLVPWGYHSKCLPT